MIIDERRGSVKYFQCSSHTEQFKIEIKISVHITRPEALMSTKPDLATLNGVDLRNDGLRSDPYNSQRIFYKSCSYLSQQKM
jgi:hypothetical protein